MKKIIGLSFLICAAAFAGGDYKQHGAGRPGVGRPPEVGGGHIPANPGPAPSKPAKPASSPAARAQEPAAPAQNRVSADKQGHPEVPHVHAKNDQWVGHNSGPNDPHYHLDQPWAHGHFPGGFGPQHVFALGRRRATALLV